MCRDTADDILPDVTPLAGVTYALTVRQPWADLIVAGVKPVENRSWRPPSTLPQWWRCVSGAVDGQRRWMPENEWQTGACDEPDGPFPFTIAIHAAASVEPLNGPAAWAWDEWERLGGWDRLLDRKRVIVGTVTVTGAHHADDPACLEVYSEGEDTYGREIERFGPCSRWAEPDRWHWTLTDAQPLDVPVPAKGRLGLWKLEAVSADV